MTKSQSNEIKHKLHRQGQSLKSWAEANGFKYRTVSDVLRGFNRGNYGEGRDIMIALGINPDEQSAA